MAVIIDKTPVMMVEPETQVATPSKIMPKPIVAPEKGKGSEDIDWLRLALATGGGLIAHSVASSIFDNKTDEEKRRESIWSKLLSSIIPIGAGALGAYGGYRIGQSMKTAAVTNAWNTVTANNGQKMVVPAENANQVAALLELMKDKPEIGFDDLIQRANELSDRKGQGELMGSIAGKMPWVEFAMGLPSAGTAARGAWNMYASNPNVIRQRAQNAMSEGFVAPKTTAVVPYKTPGMLSKIRNWLSYKKPISTDLANITNDAIAEGAKKELVPAARSSRFRRGAKQTGLGVAGLIATLGLDSTRRWLDNKANQAKREAAVGDEFKAISDSLAERMRNAKPVKQPGAAK